MARTGEESPRSANPVDRHVGARVRMRRRFLGVSQERLAEALGLTFQQVQKYERGYNRISASKLYDIAGFLKSPVGYFFEGLSACVPVEGMAEPSEAQFVHDFMTSPYGVELASLFPRLPAKLRRQVIDLVRGLTESFNEDAA